MLHHPQQPGGGGLCESQLHTGSKDLSHSRPQGLGGPAPAPPQSGPKDLSLGARAARRQDAGLRGAGQTPAAPRRGVRIFVPLQPPDTGAPHPLRPLTHPGRGRERSGEQVAPAASPAPPPPAVAPARPGLTSSHTGPRCFSTGSGFPPPSRCRPSWAFGKAPSPALQRTGPEQRRQAAPPAPRLDAWPRAAAGRGAFRAGVGWGLPAPPEVKRAQRHWLCRCHGPRSCGEPGLSWEPAGHRQTSHPRGLPLLCLSGTQRRRLAGGRLSSQEPPSALLPTQWPERLRPLPLHLPLQCPHLRDA